MIYFAKWRSKIENMVAPVPKIILNPKSHSWQPPSLVSHRKGYLLPSLNLFKVAGDKAETERSISERVNPKELFSTHSMPSIIVSDKGPQFSSEPFLLSFSKYDVVLETIFPLPKGKWWSWRTDCTVKAMILRNEDLCPTLLAYRSTLFQNGFWITHRFWERNHHSTDAQKEINRPSNFQAILQHSTRTTRLHSRTRRGLDVSARMTQ